MFIIFPNQLFEDIKLLVNKEIYIIEEPLYFYDKDIRPLHYHKCKLAYLVAAMHEYYSYLIKYGLNVTYINFNNINQFYKKISNSQTIMSYDPIDFDIINKYKNLNQAYHIIESPNFIMNSSDLQKYHKIHPKHSSFYKYVKDKVNILINIPSTDKDNRLPLPKSFNPESISKSKIYENKFYKFAKEYISNHHVFKNNPGSLEHLEMWPITFKDANEHLNFFLKNKLDLYGKYQDAIHKDDVFVFHSTLSPILNIGLLNPHLIVQKIMKQKNIPINSLEGFIRQLIGWREYMRYLYIFHYKNFMSLNFDKFKHLSNDKYNKWITGNTGLLPLDNEIKKCLEFGYAHHIVRLMIFLNIFILTRIHPEDIYKWFMEIVAMDAYDWVMKSNIYCMGYFYKKAMTKIYISSSNYILKMSNYKKDQWCKKWDALFYSYIKKYKPAPYTRNLSYFNKMSKEQQKNTLDYGNSQKY